MDEVNDDTEFQALTAALTQLVGMLSEGAALMIAEFAVVGVIRWKVWRDENGIPHHQKWPEVPWPDVCDGGPHAFPVPAMLSLDAINRITLPADGPGLLYVCGAPEDQFAARAAELARDAHPGTGHFRCARPLAGVLDLLIADDPLRQSQELVVLDQAADGSLQLSTLGLFFPGARRGDRKPFRIRCEPGEDEHGTVFAVVTCEQPHQPKLMSMRSAKLPPGRYSLTAELAGRGQVTFRSLPVSLRDDRRSWPEVLAAVPQRIDRLGPTHLIVSVEASGPTSDHVLERIDRAGQLIRRAEEGSDDQLRVSVVSYGPHAVHRDDIEEPVRILAWADTSKTALEELALLAKRGAAPMGYWRAAQLECLLTMLSGLVNAADGRPVLVTIGSRTAFPRRIDRDSEIIPCPDKRDWRDALARLRKHPEVTFGAIRDRGKDDEIWTHLGSTAFAQQSTLDPRHFAVELGLLRASVQGVPLPVIEPEGT